MIFPSRVDAGAQALHRRRADSSRAADRLRGCRSPSRRRRSPWPRTRLRRRSPTSAGGRIRRRCASSATCTLSIGRPVARATIDCALIGIWIGPRTHISPSRKSAVQLCGSSVACETNGNEYVLSTTIAADASASSTRPELCSVAGGAASSFWNCSVSVALLSFAYGPSSHCTTSASRPLNAAHVESATTATPGIRNVGLSRPLISTMSRTPGTWRALVASIFTGRPLKTGHLATAANFMFGRRTSMPNSGWPVTTLWLSAPLTRVPISR